MEATRGSGYAPVRGTPAMMMMIGKPGWETLQASLRHRAIFEKEFALYVEETEDEHRRRVPWGNGGECPRKNISSQSAVL